jgi:hypothetical protein
MRPIARAACNSGIDLAPLVIQESSHMLHRRDALQENVVMLLKGLVAPAEVVEIIDSHFISPVFPACLFERLTRQMQGATLRLPCRTRRRQHRDSVTGRLGGFLFSR